MSYGDIIRIKITTIIGNMSVHTEGGGELKCKLIVWLLPLVIIIISIFPCSSTFCGVVVSD